MPGTFRRVIDIHEHPAGTGREVRGVLEDDFHHFRVALRHDNRTVTAIDGWAVRHPYTLCAQATGELDRLAGMPLDEIAQSVTRFVDASGQCTHMLELAGLMIAAAARGLGQRRYQADVPARRDGRTRAVLYRDGRQCLAWDVQDDGIAAPEPYAGQSLRAGMARWAIGHLEVEQAEAALILRRAVLLSLGRQKNLDAQRHAEPTGACFAQQPGRAPQARRIAGSIVDFTARPQAPGKVGPAWDTAEDAHFWRRPGAS